MTGGPGPAEGAAVVGLGVMTAFGSGARALAAGVCGGRPAVRPIERFDVTGRRVRVAALLPGAGTLADALVHVVEAACVNADLSGAERARTPLLFAVRGTGALALASRTASVTGLAGPLRIHAGGCVAGSTAVADAAGAVAGGDAERVVVAAGYLVEPEQFALFDAGRALALDGVARPFSTDRRGLLLGDGVAAIVLESVRAGAGRRRPALAQVVGWGRAGDAYDPHRPHPDGRGLARAITAALGRAGVGAGDIGYVNAQGTGNKRGDAAEVAALYRALGGSAAAVPVSATKSTHGHTLEGAGLVELIVTLLGLRKGSLPVNAGYLGPDPACRLDLVLTAGRRARTSLGLCLNTAFGGANTALVVRAP